MDRIESSNKFWEIEFKDIWNIYINQNRVSTAIFSKFDPKESSRMVTHSQTEAYCEPPPYCNGQKATLSLSVICAENHVRVERNLDSRDPVVQDCIHAK